VLRAAFAPERYVASLSAAVEAACLTLGKRPAGMRDFVIYPPKVFR